MEIHRGPIMIFVRLWALGRLVFDFFLKRFPYRFISDIAVFIRLHLTRFEESCLAFRNFGYGFLFAHESAFYLKTNILSGGRRKRAICTKQRSQFRVSDHIRLNHGCKDFLTYPDAVAIWLASDETTHMTGAEFTIDGGILAGSTASPG